jgi:hypothetical protein
MKDQDQEFLLLALQMEAVLASVRVHIAMGQLWSAYEYGSDIEQLGQKLRECLEKLGGLSAYPY